MVQICPKTMQECTTTSMCSPFGGCSTSADDKFADLERQITELRAEVSEHKCLKNQIVLKAYPAMDTIDEIAEGFRSAVHFVRNNAMDMERDYPEICHAEEVFNRARAALSGSGAGGWRTMDSAPKDGTQVDLWCRAPGLSAGPARVTDCWFSDGKWWRYDEHGDDQCRSRVHNATHWMPIPAAPTGDHHD